MLDKIRKAIESISVVNGYLLTVSVAEDDNAQPNLSVHIKKTDKGYELKLEPDDGGRTAGYVAEFVADALAKHSIKYDAETKTIKSEGKKNAATKKTNRDGVQDREHHRDSGNTSRE